MTTPKISILMTVYNGGKYLQPSIDALMAQTYTDFELVIVDDASRDDSVKVIRTYTDPRIVLVCNPHNIGQTRSLNVGLKAARAPYVARMDADDKAMPQWLEHMKAFIDLHPQCVVASPQAVVIDADDRLIKPLNTPLEASEIIWKSIFASSINHVGCIMRRESILAVGGYDEQYKIVADYALWSTLLRQGKEILVYPKVLVSIRVHAHSISVLEADKRVVPEMTLVMGANINHWTQGISQDDLQVLWQCVYASHAIDDVQWNKAMAIFAGIYDSWNNTKDNDRRTAFRNAQLKTMALKRIWNLARTNQYHSARTTAQWAIAHTGGGMFLIIWTMTFLGPFLQIMARAYEQVSAWRAIQRTALK